jgi:hypothetical protein
MVSKVPILAVGTLLVTTPDIANLPFTMDSGVKVFHLIAEPVKQAIVPGRSSVSLLAIHSVHLLG